MTRGSLKTIQKETETESGVLNYKPEMLEVE